MPDLIKSTLNTDHVTMLAAGRDKKLFMVVNPVQNLISYYVSARPESIPHHYPMKKLDRAIELYNSIKGAV